MTKRTGLDVLIYGESRNKVIRDAADRILSIAEELHLTWSEFERVIDRIRENAVIASSDDPQ